MTLPGILAANGGRRISFAQETWYGERTPYSVGQDMLVFLKMTPFGLVRAAGPQSALDVGAPGTSRILDAVRNLSKWCDHDPRVNEVVG